MQVQAAGVGVGGTGFLIVVLLIVMVALICVALVGSLRRLRQRVDQGTFGQPGDAAQPGEEKAPEPATPDPGGPGAAGA